MVDTFSPPTASAQRRTISSAEVGVDVDVGVDGAVPACGQAGPTSRREIQARQSAGLEMQPMV
jgi:hypothetical protein